MLLRSLTRTTLLLAFAICLSARAQSTSPLTGTQGLLSLDGNAQSEFSVLSPKTGATQKNARLIFGDGTASTYFAIGPSATADYLRVLGSGDIGFGTTTPRAKFHVDFGLGTAFLLTRTVPFDPAHPNAPPCCKGELALSTNDIDNASVGFDAHYLGATWSIAQSATTAALLVKNGNEFRIDRWDSTIPPTVPLTTLPAMRVRLTDSSIFLNGPVGIGRYATNAVFDVAGGLWADSGITTPQAISAGTTIAAGSSISAGSNVSATGNINAGGNITATGAIYASYSQDVAEWVPSDETLQAGSVVVLDKTKRNHVQLSQYPYDSSVAGVVSGRPGIILGCADTGDAAIATTGRVPVKVDAREHAVSIGDLLVTSSTLGTAMKSIPMDLNGRAFHQPGTIIGKALEPLNGGTGEILVLLSLQ